MKGFVIGILIVSLCAAASGCAAKKSYSKTILPDQDDLLGGSGIESTDIRTVGRKMAGSILGIPEVAQAQTPPRVALLPVQNSTRFLIDKDIFTKKIRIELNENAAGRIRFVARDRMEDIIAEREAKRDGTYTSTRQEDLPGVEYYLTGELMSLSKAKEGDRSDYIIMAFQLIDAETADIVWENEYEVKRVGEAGVVYQ